MPRRAMCVIAAARLDFVEKQQTADSDGAKRRIPTSAEFSYSDAVPWRWWEARSLVFVMEAAMVVTGIILGFVALGYSCWLLFALAVNALPFFVGVTAALAASHSDCGPIGAIVLGLIAGVGTLAGGQAVFTATRSPVIRAVIALLFAAPAAVAGYHATLGLAHLGASSQGWQEIFAFIGAVVVGGSAWARMTLLAPPIVQRRVVAGSTP